MELYRVRLEWKDVHRAAEWEKRLGEALQRSIAFTEPRPPRETCEKHVAIAPGFGGSPVSRAADLACEMVIGPSSYWPAYEVAVLAVEHVGSVAVEGEVSRG